MAKEIIVEPANIWSSYAAWQGGTHEIASNDEYGITIYLAEDECDRPRIVVEADDIELYSEVIVGEHDAEETCKKIYEKYLSDGVVNIVSRDAINSEDNDCDDITDEENAIEEREAELEDALYSFLYTVCGEECVDFYSENDILEDIKEHFLEYLARKHGVPVWRPMFLEDEDGEEFFEEYPYECMIFDDEDNPIYR